MKFKKIIPKRKDIENSKFFKLLVKNSENNQFLWEFENKFIKRGAFIGVFCGFIILPIQSILSILLCKIFKGNILVAFPTTFISNPLTYIPLYYFTYKIGMIFFPKKENSNIEFSLDNIMSNFQSVIDFLIPTLIGGVIAGLFFGFISYLLTGLALYYLKK